MRHIKKFNESILDEDISYQEVSNQTWNDKYMFGDLKRFSKNELDKFIKSISEEWDVELYHGNCICLTYKDFQEMEYSIFEDDDEYFWVCLTQGSYEPRSWKCDTWEGLVKLLKDNQII